eukprot:gene28152-33993_t
MMQPEVEIDDDLESSSSYSGTFRWKKVKILPRMPNTRHADLGIEVRSINWTKGWKEYFTTRGNLSVVEQDGTSLLDPARALLQYAFNDLSLVDCLSFPLSVAFFLHTFIDELGLSFECNYEKLTIICIGCSEKAEERVLKQTNAFLELQLALFNVKSIELWLVGPEISSTSSSVVVNTRRVGDGFSSTITVSLFRGTVSAFFRAHPACLAGESIVIGYNCGFGNFENPLPKRYDLFLSWLADLVFLTSTQLPLVFFCANDYADLVGEVSIMVNILGANFLCLPAENPFSFASTMIPPAGSQKRPQEEYARGNSFFYAENKGTLIRLLTQSLSPSVLNRSVGDVARCLVTGRLVLKIFPSPASTFTGSTHNEEAAPIKNAAEQGSNLGDPIPSTASCMERESTSSGQVKSACQKEMDSSILAVEEESNQEASPLIVQQSIISNGILAVTIGLAKSIDVGCYNLKSAEVDVNENGENMRINLPSEKATPLQVSLSFIRRVRVSEGMKAKYSKKNNLLSVEFLVVEGGM